MPTISNEVPSENQLAIGGVTHKLYIHTQALQFYQCGTNPTFIFQLSMWDKPPTFTTPTRPHVWTNNKALHVWD